MQNKLLENKSNISQPSKEIRKHQKKHYRSKHPGSKSRKLILILPTPATQTL